MGSDNRIDHYANIKGLTFREIAQASGTSSRNLRKIRGGSTPSLDLARRIALALGEHPEDVFPK